MINLTLARKMKVLLFAKTCDETSQILQNIGCPDEGILKARNMKVLLVANTCEETEQILLNMTALPKLQTRTDLKPLLAGQPTNVSE